MTKSVVERVIVYLRGAAPTGSQEVERRIQAILPEASIAVHEGTSSFIGLWESARGDFKAAIADTSDPDATFTCLIVLDEASLLADAEVAYALYSKRIPVLDLRAGVAPSYVIGGAGRETKPHPMYHHANGGDATESAFKAFFYFASLEEGLGPIVVVEGGDGAGKQTQVSLLCDRLRMEGYRAETLDFPHDAADYGVLIRELLSGKMGNIREVNPLLFASLYGLNRHATLPLLRYWRQRGAVVVLDRYFTANFGHQASKYPNEADRIDVINTLQTFELKWLGLPAPARVIYLNLPPEFALAAMRGDVTREQLDMHELAGLDYKNNVRSSFLWCCTALDNWVEVPCVDNTTANGDAIADLSKRFSRDHVHEVVFGLVAPLLQRQEVGTSVQ